MSHSSNQLKILVWCDVQPSYTPIKCLLNTVHWLLVNTQWQTISIEGQFGMGIKSLQFLSLVLQMIFLAILLISDLVMYDASFLENELFSLLLLPVEVHPVTNAICS